MTKLILASASPRRAELLSRLGFPFQTMPSGASEELDASLPPTQHVLEIAARKTQAIAGQVQNAIVIGADSVISFKNTILEKPRDATHAVEMLTHLSGQTHQVLTGLVLTNTETSKTLQDVVITQVTMRNLTEEDIHRYVATGDPLDKAGAYAAQGLSAIFIDSISGCFYNVVGLPLTKLWAMLETICGQSPWSYLSQDHAAPDLLKQQR
ncbi:MAG: septum formation protein Maf [Candidatus Latescibacteria bacterium]|nr:septum formation protein Maf [Candidatus Latescibacterota bacterium]MBT4137189.1 septum formation protein Maf [Candidatus Latescibacterota bacterium]MBT5828715.1 septum formation protein Maf [Candidatus Latescibacterota bacterium]